MTTTRNAVNIVPWSAHWGFASTVEGADFADADRLIAAPHQI